MATLTRTEVQLLQVMVDGTMFVWLPNIVNEGLKPSRAFSVFNMIPHFDSRAKHGQRFDQWNSLIYYNPIRLHDGLPFVAMRGTDWQPVEAPKFRIALASSGSLNIRERIPTEFVEKIVVDFGRLFNRSTLQMRHSAAASGGQVNQAPSGGVPAGSSAASSSTPQLGPDSRSSIHLTQSTNVPEETVGYIFNEANTTLVTVYHYDFRGRRLLDGRVIRRVIGRNWRRFMLMVRNVRALLAESTSLRVHCYALVHSVSRSISLTRTTPRPT